MTTHILSGGLNQPTRDDPFAGLRPATIPMTDGARRMWEALVLDMDERCDKAIIHKTGLHVVYGRVAEHAAKLALLAHEYGQISEEAMEWGRDVALFCADALAKGLAENVSDTEWGGFLKKLLGYVRESGTITHTALLKKFNSARQRDFKEAIIQLIDSGELDYDEKKGTTGKTVRYYRVRCRDS